MPLIVRDQRRRRINRISGLTLEVTSFWCYSILGKIVTPQSDAEEASSPGMGSVKMSGVKRIWYSSPMRAAKVIFSSSYGLRQANLVLIAYASSEGSGEPAHPLRKRLHIRSVISVNYHYITVLCPFNLLIRFKCYNTV